MDRSLGAEISQNFDKNDLSLNSLNSDNNQNDTGIIYKNIIEVKKINNYNTIN